MADQTAHPLPTASRWTPVRVCGGFFALALTIRLGLIGVNRAEYTDGILAVVGSEGAQTFWPPLYGWLCAAIGLFGVGPEMAGRLVSVVSGAALVVPVYATAHGIDLMRHAKPVAGRIYRAPIYACLWLLVSPMALRWSLRMMTDALFALLFFGAVWAMAEAWRRRRSGFLHTDRLLGVATALSVAATLTRYQGIVLLPLLAAAIGAVYVCWRRRGVGPMWMTCFAQFLWLVAIVWLFVARDRIFAHGGQFADRAGEDASVALVRYWSVFESFVLLSPYFFTYPIFAFAVWGAIRGRDRALLLMFGYCALALLAMQSAFQSFQSRYLLPLLPFFVVFAGAGCADVCERVGRRRGLWFAAVAACALYCYVFSMAVTIRQAGVFGDIKSAAKFVAETAAPDAPIYSNEQYGPQAIPIKMRFWSGRDVAFWQGQPLPAGAIVCLHNFVGEARYHEAAEHLKRTYDFHILNRYYENVLPLLPEVMATDIAINGVPFSPQQKPLAWIMRYTPQRFETTVIEILGPKQAGRP